MYNKKNFQIENKLKFNKAITLAIKKKTLSSNHLSLSADKAISLHEKQIKSFKLNQFGLQNKTNLQNINTQLSLFLKTYKIKKSVNNYKNSSNLIEKNNLELNKYTQSRDNKSIVSTIRTNKNLNNAENTAPYGSLSHAQVLITRQKTTQGSSFKGLNKVLLFSKTNFKTKITYNSFKKFLRESNYTNEFMPLKSSSLGDLKLTVDLFENKINDSKSGSASALSNCLKIKQNKPGTVWQPELCSGQCPEYQRHRTYSFLQTLLIKYLERKINATNYSKAFKTNKTVLGNTFDRAMLNCSITRLSNPFLLKQKANLYNKNVPTSVFETKLKTTDSSSNNLNTKYPFLFSKINNKSFLTYWLIPIAGLAFLAPTKLIYNTNAVWQPELCSGLQQPIYRYNNSSMFLIDNTQLHVNKVNLNLLKVGNPNDSVFFNNLNFYITTKKLFCEKFVSNNKAAPYGSLSSAQVNKNYKVQEDYFQTKKSLTNNSSFLKEITESSSSAFIPVKNKLSNVYNIHPLVSNIKNTLLNNILFVYNQRLDLTLLNIQFFSTWPKSRMRALQKLVFEPRQKITYSMSKSLNAQTFQTKIIGLNNHIVSNTTNNKYSLISPLESKTFLQKNLNFITTKNTLKLLKLKLRDFNKESHKNYKQQPLMNYKKALQLMNFNIHILSKKTFQELIFDKNNTKKSDNLYLEKVSNLPYKILFKELNKQNNLKLFSRNVQDLKTAESQSSYEMRNLDSIITKNKFLVNCFSIINTASAVWQLQQRESKRSLSSDFQKTATSLILSNERINDKLRKQANQAHSDNIYPINKQMEDYSNQGKECILSWSCAVWQPELCSGEQDRNIIPLKLKINLIRINNTNKTNLNKSILEKKKQPNFSTWPKARMPALLHLITKSILEKNQTIYKNGTNFYFNYLNNNLKKFMFCNNVTKNKSYNTIINKNDKSLYKKNFKVNNFLMFNTKQFLHSISIIFKHQKMFKNKTLTQLDKKAFFESTPRTINSSNTSMLAFSQEELNNFNEHRLSLQKKRKAKKQRLETRRQKKRTRFFPRPQWLRYRMFVNFLKQRNLIHRNYKKNKIQVSYNKQNLFYKKNTTVKNLPLLNTELFLYKQFSAQNFQLNLANKLGYKMYFINTKKARSVVEHKNYSKDIINKIRKINNKTNYRDLKIKANYVNFKNQKNANPPPTDKDKDKDKDTIFRDLWIWAYNNTILNNYQQYLGFLLPNNKEILVMKKAKIKKLDVLTLKNFGAPCLVSSLSWSCLKNRFSNRSNALKKYFFAPSYETQYLGTQNNKISLSSKRNFYSIYEAKNALALTRIHWALNKTNTNSFTETNKRYIVWGQQKLRNQSKNNKTKYLEKQFITNWERFFLNKKINRFYKKIINKLQHKISKLNYLITYSANAIPQPQNLVLKHSSVQLLNTNQSNIRSIEKDLYANTSSLNLKHITVFNNSWWTNFNIKSLLKVTSINKTINKNRLDNYESINFKKFDNKSLYSKTTVLLSCTVILHFCALISLVSISQVRCFIKFHIIFLYKLSNIYNSLIIKMTDLFLLFNLKLSNKSLNTALFVKRKNRIKSTVRDVMEMNINVTETESLDQVNLNKIVSFNKGVKKAKSKLLTYFSLSLLQKQFIPVQKAFIHSKDYKKTQPTLKQLATNHYNNTLLRKSKDFSDLNLSIEQKLLESVSSSLCLGRTTFGSSRSYLQRESKLSAVWQPELCSGFGCHTAQDRTFTKYNLISLKSNFIKQNDFRKKIVNNTKLLKQKQLVSLISNYKGNTIKMTLKKHTIYQIRSSKNVFLKSVFMLIDLFQSVVRSISSFFEKPAEFTTNWIAFGFLVEWSSDLITIIPENIDIYIWNAFAKVSHITKNLLISNNLASQSIYSLPLFSAFTESTMSKGLFNNSLHTTQHSNILFLHVPSLILLNYLVQRRILYFFDRFIETISQPDADLMRRQKKGTLFWDIWADFLVTAADYYNINVAALSTIKSEQNNLIETITNYTWSDKTDENKNKSYAVNKVDSLNLTNENIFTPQKLVQDLSWLSLNSKKQLISSGLNYFDWSETIASKWRHRTSNTINPIRQSFHHSFNKNPLLTKVLTNINKWSINQYITYQSWHSHNGSNNSNGDLFIDYHPPKSFSHIPAIKYNKILQQPIGTLVCQIYSGLFNQQVSKNILLVNPKISSNGTLANKKQMITDYNILLIQALAGETELKIITDNAQRYALVNRGFAIGIKLLRDVFDAISLNTPCIFLLLDIHAIGERRPMLISDYGAKNSDDNGSFKEDFFGSQRDEVHEKNQVVYQLTRHAITHYRKPFKGDYSLAIPTNLYVNDLFLKAPTQTTTNLSLIESNNSTIKNKINYMTMKNQVAHSGSSISCEIAQSQRSSSGKSIKKILNDKKQKNTHLQFSQLNKKFTPPSTSPFTVLLLKEEKKLKPNKIVEEFPWTGLPGEELAIKPRTSYSVRAKVSMLAELALSNLSAKLDMITDLLVIIDSVRSNKGFVVFATTNVPQVLDPALRRPGRLDETICIPNIINSAVLKFTTNYEIIKSVKSGFSTRNNSIYLSWFKNHYNFNQAQELQKVRPALKRYSLIADQKILTVNLKDYNAVLNTEYLASHNILNYALISHSNILKRKLQSMHNSRKTQGTSAVWQLQQRESKLSLSWSKDNILPRKISILSNNYESCNETLNLLSIDKKIKTKISIKALAYYQVGQILVNYYLNNKGFNTEKSNYDLNKIIFSTPKSINYLTLYNSKNIIIKQLMSLFSGKISQLLGIEKNFKTLSVLPVNITSNVLENSNSSKTYLKSRLITSNQINEMYKENLFNFDMSQVFQSNSNFQLATSIMLSFIHKRYLYRKNLIVPKLLSFVDGNVLDEPPSPPFSSLLIPAKRFENYKRVFHDSISGNKLGQRKAQISFTEKINYHMQLQSIKILKNQPQAFAELYSDLDLGCYTAQKFSLNNSASDPRLRTMNGSSNHENVKNQIDLSLQPEALIKTNQSNHLIYENLLKMTLADKHLQTPTNINWYYQNRILKRHGQYLTNQWWNGQLSEHNAETVFLSDIDWRSSFIKNKQIKVSKIKNLYNLVNIKKQVSGLDILLDFPDTDQFYNPRRRRWLLNKGYWSFWFNFDKVYSEEIISAWISESLVRTYTYLHNNLELLDFITTKYIALGYTNGDNLAINSTQIDYNKTKEIILTNSIKRF